MEHQELIPHLFRSEFGKITTVLCKTFGLSYMELAEDIASDTFVQAYETWSRSGVPENPKGWLYAVAKNKTLTHLNRDATFKKKVLRQQKNNETWQPDTDIDLSDTNIRDSQLRMLFAVCHPALAPEAQIGLALRILCGFGIEEIATALLTNKEAITKRLYRAREKLRQEKTVLTFPENAALKTRLESVLTTLYLLFNEGYYSESNEAAIRKDLCLEAMRLTYLLQENQSTDLPETNALLSLMCFHASRLDARQDAQGNYVLYEDQDVTLWNQELIQKGIIYLHKSTGSTVSTYHLEAAIAYWHTVKADVAEKWQHILQLYNKLLILEYTPIAALNRTYALSKVHGPVKAIEEAEKLNLHTNPYYHTLLGVLYKDIDKQKALTHLESALAHARTETDMKLIRTRIQLLDSSNHEQ